MKIKAILTKPLDGDAEGTEREFSKSDFDRLAAKGAVRAAEAEGEGEGEGKGEDLGTVDGLGEGAGEKLAPAVKNKKAPVVENKASE